MTLPGRTPTGFLNSLSEEGILLEDPVTRRRVVPDDPKDDYLVALALAAGADPLVTRDRHVDKVTVRGLRVIGARESVRRIRLA
jgi:predicted nucleic acid-binding protein